MKLVNVVFVLCVGLLGAAAGSGVAWLTSPAKDPAELVSGNYSEHFDVGSPDLILYSTSTCPWCKKTRAWLDSHHVRYEDRVIDKDQDQNRRFRSLGQPGVPVLISSDRLLNHYDESLLSEWLRSSR